MEEINGDNYLNSSCSEFSIVPSCSLGALNVTKIELNLRKSLYLGIVLTYRCHIEISDQKYDERMPVSEGN